MTRPVVIEFRADDGSLIRSMRTTGNQADRLAGQLDRTGDRAERMGRQTEQSATRMNNLRVAAAATSVVLAAKTYARIADDMATMNARLRLATDGTAEFNQAQADVTRIANDNGRQLGAISELYTRLAQATEDYEGKARDTAIITETVTRAMRVSGTSTQESAGAIRQLSQAFASGVLRGDEFNSVNEQAPRIMQALADSLGVTRGELRGMAEQGELTADILRRALIDEAGAIAEESAQIPQTLGEAFTKLVNNVMLVVGAFDAATGSSRSAADRITSVAERIGNAADWIRERILTIRLATIAFGESIKIVMAEIGGAFTFAQGIYTQFFTVLDNAWNKTVRVAANSAATLVETTASIADFIPDFVPVLGGASDSAAELAAQLRRTAAGTRETAIEVDSFGDVWDATRDSVNQAKDEIRQASSAQADAAIAALQAAGATGELTDATNEANEARKESEERSKEVIESIEDMAESLANQAEKLREEVVLRAAGTRGLIDYRIAKLAAAGATEEEIQALRDARDAVLDQEGALEALTRAQQVAIEQAEAQAAAMLRTAAAAFEAATGMRIFNDENQRAGSGGGGGFGSAFSSIGSGFAQSIFNGQSIGDALESAFTGFGGEQLSKSAGQFFDDAASDGLSAAFQNSKTQEGMAGGFALAIGQAVQGNYVQAAFTAAGTAIAGPIGGMIGSIIGGLIGQKSDPNFQIRGTGLQGRDFRNIDTDEVLTTALGQVEFGFRYIEGGVQSQVMNALEAVDASIAGALRGGSLMEGARAALETFGASSREFDGDLEALLEKRLQAVVRTLDSTVADMILSASSLEGQLENLQSVMAINRQLLAGATLGLPADFTATTVAPPVTGTGGPGGGPGGPIRGDTIGDTIKQTVASITDSASGFNSALQSVGEGVDSAAVQTSGLAPELAATVQALVQVRIANEPLVDTFNRTVQVLGTLDTASALLGARFGETRIAAIQFGADLVALFGDDAGALAQGFGRIFDAFYTEQERAAAQAGISSTEATRLISGLLNEIDGFEFDPAQLTQQGFRELFESLTSLGILTAEQTAVLLNAGSAVADYIDAQTTLNDAIGDGTDEANRRAEAARRAQEAADFMADINSRLLQQVAPSWSTFDQLTRSIAETMAAAQSLGLSEEQLARVRQLAQAQMDAFVAATGRNIEVLRDQFKGADNPAELFAGTVESTAGRVASAAGSIGDSITSSLEGIQDWLNREVLSETSNLTPQERLTEARAQFDDALASGNIGDLTRLADQLLGEGAGFFGRSSEGFDALRDYVRGTLEDLSIESPDGRGVGAFHQQTAQIANATEGTQSATEQTAQYTFEQLRAASALIQEVAVLAQATGRLPSEIGAEYDLPMRDLIHAVTGELPSATGDALGDYFDELVGETQNELNALLDMSATADAQLTVLDSIDASLRDIAGRPESDPLSAGQQRRSAGEVAQPIDADLPSGAPASQSVGDPLLIIDRTLQTENAALREELRALQDQMRSLIEITDAGNRDRRSLVAETAGVGEDVRRSGEQISRSISSLPGNRRLPGG